MANLDFDLGVLERQLHQARQNAIQAELAAAGLQEIGHPMLLCVLGITGSTGWAPRCAPSGSWPGCSTSPRRR